MSFSYEEYQWIHAEDVLKVTKFWYPTFCCLVAKRFSVSWLQSEVAKLKILGSIPFLQKYLAIEIAATQTMSAYADCLKTLALQV
jgi:hypothetical protein